MASRAPDLDELWHAIAVSTLDEHQIVTRPLEFGLPLGPIRVGLDSAGVRHLLIPVPSDGDVVEDKRSKGVVVVAQHLEHEDKLQWYADLVCVEPGLGGVYAKLANAVCESVGVVPQDAGSIPARLLEEWRELLARPNRGLGREAALGLFGEMLMLRRGVRATGPGFYTAWVGPERGQHDFRGHGVSMEVKATGAREGERVEIHGIEQLDTPTEHDRLFLSFVRLLEDPEGEGFEDLLDDLVGMGVAEVELRKKLRQVGYDEPEQEYRFIARETKVFEVTNDFPAITRASFTSGLPSGVESLRYTINLSAAGDPVEDIDRVLQIIDGGR